MKGTESQIKCANEIRTRTIHLQGIGERPAIYVADCKPGMKRLYNYGYVYEIVSVEPMKSGKSVKIILLGDDGKLYRKTMRSNTLVAIA